MKRKTIAEWLKKASSIFSIFQIPHVPEYGDAQKKRHRKEAVMQTSNGNVLLQLGHYVTEEELDRLRKDLAL
ncbi:MAG: hypothetical protein HGB11_12430 [Chlorobiales bacterium]|nr:hypothetical protein [Chlorobiales bacterium]